MLLLTGYRTLNEYPTWNYQVKSSKFKPLLLTFSCCSFWGQIQVRWYFTELTSNQWFSILSGYIISLRRKLFSISYVFWTEEVRNTVFPTKCRSPNWKFIPKLTNTILIHIFLVLRIWLIFTMLMRLLSISAGIENITVHLKINWKY